MPGRIRARSSAVSAAYCRLSMIKRRHIGAPSAQASFTGLRRVPLRALRTDLQHNPLTTHVGSATALERDLALQRLPWSVGHRCTSSLAHVKGLMRLRVACPSGQKAAGCWRSCSTVMSASQSLMRSGVRLSGPQIATAAPSIGIDQARQQCPLATLSQV